jgi:hypothetical protein
MLVGMPGLDEDGEHAADLAGGERDQLVVVIMLPG